jgi:hypothetical protein
MELQESLTKCCTSFDEADAHMTDFGVCLGFTKEAFMDLSAYQAQFEDSVMQDLVDPSKELMEDDIKKIAAQQKKLESKRLQFDFKRDKNESAQKKGTAMPISEHEMTESKAFLDTAKDATATMMGDLLRKQGEHVVSQLICIPNCHPPSNPTPNNQLPLGLQLEASQLSLRGTPGFPARGDRSASTPHTHSTYVVAVRVQYAGTYSTPGIYRPFPSLPVHLIISGEAGSICECACGIFYAEFGSVAPASRGDQTEAARSNWLCCAGCHCCCCCLPGCA